MVNRSSSTSWGPWWSTDSTLSRIHNWAQMTDAERERTIRVLEKRNMLRKEAIQSQESEASSGQASN